MTQNFHKTEHFLYRQWDRGIEDNILEAIICKIRPKKAKTTIITSPDFLKSLNRKILKKSHLIIVAKGKSLLTIFFVNDLYAYLKSRKGNINPIIVA